MTDLFEHTVEILKIALKDDEVEREDVRALFEHIFEWFDHDVLAEELIGLVKDYDLIVEVGDAYKENDWMEYDEGTIYATNLRDQYKVEILNRFYESMSLETLQRIENKLEKHLK